MDLDKLKDWIIQNIRPITYMVGAVVALLVLAAARAGEGVALLEKVVTDNGRTRAAYEAIIGIADIHADAKNYAEAAKQYARAADKAPDDFAKVMATYNKAGAEEFAGD